MVLALIILTRLGRSFSINAEARRLVTEGPYAVIRHPLYLAEQIALIGVFIEFFSLPAALLIVAQFDLPDPADAQRGGGPAPQLSRVRALYGAHGALIPGVW